MIEINSTGISLILGKYYPESELVYTLKMNTCQIHFIILILSLALSASMKQ